MSKISMRLPKTLQDGDEITIGGNLQSDANGFYVNFTDNTEEEEPEDIMYRFQVVANKITQDWKTCGEWMPGENHTDTYLLDESKLILTFKFSNNEVLVYSGDEERNFECQFRLEHPMAKIGQVRVCGDLERLNHVTFRYA